jgi:hypothetical protein
MYRAKMRADAAAKRKAAADEAQAKATTAGPGTRHDSMDPQGEVAEINQGTKTTEVKKKRWFKRLF